MERKLKSVENQYKIILDNLNLIENKRVLEIGAGQKIIKKFLPKNVEYKSLDYRGKHDYIFNLDDIYLPINDKSFDIIICLDCLEHVMYPKNVLKEINRVLSDKGILFLSMPNEYNFIMRLYYLIGKKTDVDKPFEVVNKHLHIHKPRVKDILWLFSNYFHIEEIRYVWQSRQSYRNILALLADKLIRILARIYPSMFSRMIIVKCRKK
ncbi:methyltransferase domain-containing protein [Candidatus Pacearchaeota archaeon]|nr:methyltransferase domain-containing protein [Candidatus Pacearchaeota archaeon]